MQWVPGEGQPQHTEWPDVYRKVRDSGKLIQTWGDMKALDTLASQLGDAKGIIIFCTMDISEKAKAEEFLEKYGAL